MRMRERERERQRERDDSRVLQTADGGGCKNVISDGRAVVECRDHCQHHGCNGAGHGGHLDILLLPLLSLLADVGL